MLRIDTLNINDRATVKKEKGQKITVPYRRTEELP